MKMCCCVSFGIYNTWHRPPVAENWLGRHCKAKLLPSQQQVAAWHELLWADINPNLLGTAALGWEMLIISCLYAANDVLLHTHPAANHSLNIRRPCTTSELLEAAWSPAGELPSVSLSLGVACLLPYLAYLHTLGTSSHLPGIWRLSAPLSPGEQVGREQKVWINLSPAGAAGLEATLS